MAVLVTVFLLSSDLRPLVFFWTPPVSHSISSSTALTPSSSSTMMISTAPFQPLGSSLPRKQADAGMEMGNPVMILHASAGCDPVVSKPVYPIIPAVSHVNWCAVFKFHSVGMACCVRLKKPELLSVVLAMF